MKTQVEMSGIAIFLGYKRILAKFILNHSEKMPRSSKFRYLGHLNRENRLEKAKIP